MKKIAIGLAIVIGVLALSCRYLLPERFAVNAPIGQMLFGASEMPEDAEIRSRMQVPKGFSIGVYAEGIQPSARFLRFTERGDLLVTTPRSGGVVLLERDSDRDGRADGMRVLVSELNRPHGVELRDGWLYIGETDAIARVRFDPASGQVSGEIERIVTGLPGGGNHWTKTLRFGPDGWLYMHVGSTCNVCIEDDERRATIMRFRPDGSEGHIYAAGLRNSVGFDWQPGTGDLYATDNGRDLLGDDFPPCELNRIVEDGFYGWPIANGDRIPDPDFGDGQSARIEASIPPAHPFRAHNAPLGMTFIRSTRVPASYQNAALVALHGSWNRSNKDGYKVVSLHWQADGSIREQDFATGFEQDEDVIGRPVDVIEGPDGAFYVSDDYAGAIWRIAYGEEEDARATQLPGTAEYSDPLAGIDPEERAELSQDGASLYEEFACATCHEPEHAVPGTAVKRLEKLDRRYTIDTLSLLFETPPQPMPIYPLSDAQKRALAVHLLESHR